MLQKSTAMHYHHILPCVKAAIYTTFTFFFLSYKFHRIPLMPDTTKNHTIFQKVCISLDVPLIHAIFYVIIYVNG